MNTGRISTRYTIASLLGASIISFMSMGSAEARASEFDRYLAYVDQSLRTNPNHVAKQALYSCRDRRDRAAWLDRKGEEVRAVRSLKYCFSLLGLSEADVDRAPDPAIAEKRRAKALAAVRTKASKEGSAAGTLVPDLRNGLEIYRECASCHMPEGWGMKSGIVPQLAGQHRSVIIKQLADIRSGYRKNQVMAPYASVESIGGAQAVADVAGYIDTLEMTTENGQGPGKDLARGERLYRENCVQCHGASGQGDADKSVPRIQSQHFGYLTAQFQLIKDGDRKNANPEMVEQIKDFDEEQILAVMDYVSRLEPPEEMQAPADWRNPDFMLPSARR